MCGDPMLAKKIGATDNPHRHIGANTHGNHIIVDHAAVANPGIISLLHNVNKGIIFNKLQRDIWVCIP